MTNEPTRRRVLQVTGIAAAVTLAGCSATGDSSEGTTSAAETETEAATETETETETATATETETATETTETTEGSDSGPYALDEVHYHGEFLLTVNDTEYTFGDESQNWEQNTGDPHFHFHDDGSDTKYHVHSKGVTLAYAADTLPDLDLSESQVTFRGTTYDASDAGTEIQITAGGSEVTPTEYTFTSGEDISVTVESDTPAPDA